MRYYIAGGIVADSNFLAHHGIQGQKWGVRRFQNEDGTLTEAGKKRYYKDDYKKGDIVEKRLMREANRSEKKAYKYINKAEKAEAKGKTEKAGRFKERATAWKRNSDEAAKDIERYNNASYEDRRSMRKDARLSSVANWSGGLASMPLEIAANRSLRKTLSKYGGQTLSQFVASGRSTPDTNLRKTLNVVSGVALAGFGVGLAGLRHSDDD